MCLMIIGNQHYQLLICAFTTNIVVELLGAGHSFHLKSTNSTATMIASIIAKRACIPLERHLYGEVGKIYVAFRAYERSATLIDSFREASHELLRIRCR